MVGSIMVWHLPPSCRAGGFPVHHDPMHGIVANPENREWGQSPLSFFVVCDNPVHRVLVNWEPPISQVIHLPGGIQNCNASIIENVEIAGFFRILICIDLHRASPGLALALQSFFLKC